jgi:hypothetical protein
MRRSILALGALGVAVVVALAASPSRAALGDAAVAILGPAVLPNDIEVCGRDYNGRGPVATRAQAEAVYGSMPPVVSAWGMTSCPADGWCDGGAPCATVVYVSVGDAGYVSYGLVGGP